MTRAAPPRSCRHARLRCQTQEAGSSSCAGSATTSFGVGGTVGSYLPEWTVCPRGQGRMDGKVARPGVEGRPAGGGRRRADATADRGAATAGSRRGLGRLRRRDTVRHSPGATGPRRSFVADDAVTGNGAAMVRRCQPLAGGRPREVAGAARSAATSPGSRRASCFPPTVRAFGGMPAGARAATSQRECVMTPAES